MFALSRVAIRAAVASKAPHFSPISPATKSLGQRGTPFLAATRHFGRGQGNAGGWPSTTGNPSGGGRSNNPPQAIEKERDARGRHVMFRLYHSEFVDSNFDERVTAIACGEEATIMIFEDGDTAWTKELPIQLYNKLNGRQKSLPKPEYVALGSKDRYFVRFRDGASQWSNHDEGFTKIIKEDERAIRSIAFGEHSDSYFIVYENGGYNYCNVPSALDDLMEERGQLGDINCVSLGPDGEYFVEIENGQAWWGGTTEENLERISQVRDRVHFIDFGDDGTFLCRYT